MPTHGATDACDAFPKIKVANEALQNHIILVNEVEMRGLLGY